MVMAMTDSYGSSSVGQDEGAATVDTHLTQDESNEDSQPQHPGDAEMRHPVDIVPATTVSIGTCIRPNLVYSGSSEIPSIAHNCDVPVVPSVHSSAPGAFNVPVFNKLPHPAERLLRELPVVDGLQAKELLHFLGLVIKIRTLFPMSDLALLEIIYPYCREPLCARVSAALGSRLSFAQFHADVLQFFVPKRLFDTLRQDLFGRLQGENEPFSSYVSSIKQAAVVLKLPVTEKEIVSNILEGLSPTQRTRFVFQSPPDNFESLDRLCVQDQNIAYSEQLRSRDTSFVPSLSSRSNPFNQNFTHRNGTSVAGNTPPGPKTCFYCKRTGHIKKDCRQWLAASRSRNLGSQSSGRPA
jgi:hypothetical protein